MLEEHPEDCSDELLGDKLQEVMRKMQKRVSKGRGLFLYQRDIEIRVLDVLQICSFFQAYGGLIL